jgi:hypothetical protein
MENHGVFGHQRGALGGIDISRRKKTEASRGIDCSSDRYKGRVDHSDVLEATVLEGSNRPEAVVAVSEVTYWSVANVQMRH